jgi:hypothetical protein
LSDSASSMPIGVGGCPAVLFVVSGMLIKLLLKQGSEY